jgi:hypothetical protein
VGILGQIKWLMVLGGRCEHGVGNIVARETSSPAILLDDTVRKEGVEVGRINGGVAHYEGASSGRKPLRVDL